MLAQPEISAEVNSPTHELSICSRDASGDLATFLHEHWKRDHVLAKSLRLLDWQHLDAANDRYSFVIARNRSGTIDAVLGFIPTSQFDPALSVNGDIWLAIWKVRDGAKAAGLGLMLLSYLTRILSPATICAIGLGRGVVPIYRCLGFAVGKLDHWYIVNRNKRNFSLLGGDMSISVGSASADRLPLARQITCRDDLDSLDAALFNGPSPQKSGEYIHKRYLNHPTYRYELLAIREGAKTLGLLVARKVSHNGAHCLRIVDYFGPSDRLRGCGEAFQSLLIDIDAEYLDFYCHGINHDDLRAAGFVLRDSKSPIIVPNYFEPFEQRNVELEFAHKRYRGDASKPFVMFRGDSDQDRPSVIGSAA